MGFEVTTEHRQHPDLWHNSYSFYFIGNIGCRENISPQPKRAGPGRSKQQREMLGIMKTYTGMAWSISSVRSLWRKTKQGQRKEGTGEERGKRGLDFTWGNYQAIKGQAIYCWKLSRSWHCLVLSQDLEMPSLLFGHHQGREQQYMTPLFQEIIEKVMLGVTFFFYYFKRRNPYPYLTPSPWEIPRWQL